MSLHIVAKFIFIHAETWDFVHRPSTGALPLEPAGGRRARWGTYVPPDLLTDLLQICLVLPDLGW